MQVVVLFRATGDAPILKHPKVKISGDQKIGKVIEFLKRQLKKETLFVYVNSAFALPPTKSLLTLFRNFSTDGKQLVVNVTPSLWLGADVTLNPADLTHSATPRLPFPPTRALCPLPQLQH